MIPPTPGPDAASRLFGPATPPDGAGPLGPDQYWPQRLDVPFSEVLSGLNPLQHIPGVGMAYRAITGEEIPMPMRFAGAALFGGPVGLAGSILFGFVSELFRMGPDTSRPPVPEGMSVTGSEAPISPVTPGTKSADGYLTLATNTPEWLEGPGGSEVLLAQGDIKCDTACGGAPRGATVYAAAMDWQRSAMVEKGLA